MELLHNRYEIIKRLSDTSVFEVYLAKDKISDKNVSVYKVKESFMQDYSFVNGLTQGIIDCRDLNHINTLKFIDVAADEESESLIFVYEYADGVSLKEVFARQSRLPLQKSIEIAISVLHSLDNAHLMGICHGDLCADDVFITQDGQIKVRGYGRCDGRANSSIAKEHLSLETIRYQSPEVLEGTGLYEASDVYGVGCLLYQMLTGRLPFDGNTSVEIATKILRDAPLSPRMINRELSASLSSLILEAINKEYNARVGTASVFVSRLRDAERCYRQGEYSAPHENVLIKNETEKGNKKGSTAMLLGVLFVLVCLVACGVTLISINAKKVKTPNIVGLSEEEAISKLQGLKINFNKCEDQFSEEYETGIVCDQSPKGGERINKRDKIDYFVSKGVPSIKMPYLIGLYFEDAKQKLAKGNLDIEIGEEYLSSVPEGTVIRTIPDANVTLENGAHVVVILSSYDRNAKSDYALKNKFESNISSENGEKEKKTEVTRDREEENNNETLLPDEADSHKRTKREIRREEKTSEETEKPKIKEKSREKQQEKEIVKETPKESEKQKTKKSPQQKSDLGYKSSNSSADATVTFSD